MTLALRKHFSLMMAVGIFCLLLFYRLTAGDIPRTIVLSIVGGSLFIFLIKTPGTKLPNSNSKDIVQKLNVSVQRFIKFVQQITWFEWLSVVLLPLSLIELYIQSSDLSLHHFHDRILGISVMEGTDVAARSQVVFTGLILGIGLTLLVLLSIFSIKEVWTIENTGVNLRRRMEPIHYFSFLIILVFFADENAQQTLHYYFQIEIFMLFIAFYPLFRFSRRVPYAFLIANALATVSVMVSSHNILQWKLAKEDDLELYIWIALLVTTAGVPWLIDRMINKPNRYQAVTVAYIPLILTLTVAFGAEETGYALFYRYGKLLNFSDLAAMFFWGFTSISIFFLLICWRTGRPRISVGRILGIWILPITLVSLVIYYNFLPAGSPFIFDWFHMG
ncbi:MAG: hypothetical protein WBF29_01480, partial [Syntrophobacteria bacterium]